MSVEIEKTGVERDGQEIVRFDIAGPSGLKMQLLNYGGIITKLFVPAKDGTPVDVVLGFDDLEDYFTRSPKCGALVGRFANRIDGSSFELNGISYDLEPSRDGYTIHGGPHGFDKRVFDWEVTGDSTVTLRRISPDGEAGFPGALTLAATYALTADNALVLTYDMTSDKDTVVNITNHSYFNLSGAGSGSINDHVVMIASDAFCEADGRGVPTGVMLSVEGTPMDFRRPHPVEDTAGEQYEQLNQYGGYDHNYALGAGGIAASAWSPVTGICMTVKTTMPAVQFYTSNGMQIENAKGGASYGPRAGLCFETQFYPDSPHHANFPSCVLPAGEQMVQQTTYAFSISDDGGCGTDEPS